MDLFKLNITIKLFAFLLCAVPLTSQSPGENVTKIVFDKDDDLHGYYLAIPPSSNEIEATLVLFPGLGQKAEDVLRDSELYHYAEQNNILTLLFSTGMRISVDSLLKENLTKGLNNAIKTYGLNKNKFVFGGFSAGGMISLRYAQLCKEFPNRYPVNPLAVFMADAPVDIFHSWETMQTLKKQGDSQVAIDEADWVEKIYNAFYGATPETNQDIFEQMNSFSFSKQGTGKEKHLKDVAVRAYHDVDIPWRLTERNQSVSHSNFLVTSELINRLLKLGNENAEFVQSFQTGYRANGKRHPHSWSIIDAKECIEWIGGLLGVKEEKSNAVNGTLVTPIRVSKESLSGLNMNRGRSPSQPERILYFQNIFQGADLNVQVVSSENASASPEDLELDEFLFLTNGAALLSPKDQKDMQFVKGDFFMVPRGFNGRWETIGAPSFHHEISIVSAQRNPNPTNPEKRFPVLMDKWKLAGQGLTKIASGRFEDLLYTGHELTIRLKAEEPSIQEIKEPLSERILYVLAGSLELVDLEGTAHKFNSGDFVIIPKGFSGTWKTKAHELFRALEVQKTIADNF